MNIHGLFSYKCNLLEQGINPKVDVVVQLEFELAYHDVAVQYVSYYIPVIPAFFQESGIA